MDEPFIGTIMFVPYNFAPKNWAFCSGQLLQIATNQALFSLLGTTYGGNGQITFALPNLQGRAPIGYGQGNGLSNISIGQAGGQENVTLTLAEMPAHTHTGNVILGSGLANNANGTGNNFAANTGGTSIYNSGALGDDMAANVTIVSIGGNQPHNNMSPFLVLNCCICLAGLYPSRN